MPKIRISRLTNSVTKITKQLSKPLSGIANNNKYCFIKIDIKVYFN